MHYRIRKDHMKTVIGFTVIYHPFEENAEAAPNLFRDSLELLESSFEATIVSAGELVHDLNSARSAARQFKTQKVDVICLKLATWSSDDLILEMSAVYDVPFIFWSYSHVHAGSLCGAQQFNMVFKELGRECIVVHGNGASSLTKLLGYTKCVALKNRLQKLRLCRIGNRTQGMSEVICDDFSVKEILGPSIFSVGMDEFTERVGLISTESAREQWDEVRRRITQVHVKDEDGIHAMKNHLALKALLREKHLDGVTVECYPRYMGKLCLSFSLLGELGIPGACEGDVHSLILMEILMNLSNAPVYDIDLLDMREDDNTILGSHCGCGAFPLARSKKEIQLSHVRLANEGVCVLFPSKPGEVTMANLVGRTGTYRMGILEGKALDVDMEFQGNPIKVKLPIEISRFSDIVEERGLGHHWIIAYGYHAEELKRVCSLLGVKAIDFS